MAKYDKIGIQYNQTRTADPHLLQRIWQLLQVQDFQLYLDIGCGTGNYTNALHQMGIQIKGVDPSQKMLEAAKAKNQSIEWVQGSAEDIPFDDQFFDGALASLTLHHWSDLNKGFGELNRVLKPESRLVIFTASRKQMQGYWLNHYFPQMLADSIKQMPAYNDILRALNTNGFELAKLETYFVQRDLQDKFLYAGKHDPSFYLNPIMRKGISSFSALANKEEVENGLQEISEDIKSGKIVSIIKSFENDFGDYLFVVAKKLKLFKNDTQ